MNEPAGARGIIEYQGKYLLVKNNRSQADFWCLPGGGVHEGEEILQALEREIIEELGVKPVIGNLLFVHQMKNKQGIWGHPDFLFYIKNGADYLNLDLAKTTHGLLELNAADFKDIADPKFFVLPDFLKTELPKLKQQNFMAPTQFKYDTFLF